MTISPIALVQSINKSYRLIKPRRHDFDIFKNNFNKLLSRIDERETEENVKGHLADFLRSTYYFDNHLIATKERADLVIHLEKDAKSPVGVLFEVKKPTNKADMVTRNNLNTRAMHELILYFLRERVNHKNISITHLVITNIYEWFVFDASLFDKVFAQNKQLEKAYKEWERGQKVSTKTDLFYNEIVKPFIDELDNEFTFTYIDIREYTKYLKTDKDSNDNKLIPLYKFFTPANLLKLPFVNDSNALDKGFFKELLHIIGLEEVKSSGKKVIQRLPADKRSAGSLIENAINVLEYDGVLYKVDSKLLTGKTADEQLFNLGLELCITWVNRILFLKLLEGQLLKYHNDNPVFKFVNVQSIKNYGELNRLFFQVLAQPADKRSAHVQQKFSHIPYLNSSLFEHSEQEDVSIKISELDGSLDMDLYPDSVLKRRKKKGSEPVTMNTLQYILNFLEAYDFASMGKEEVQEENKTIINAAVLGLVFEKINGYRDGSFYTPGAITMYMCHQTIRRAVVQKFNDTFEWTCATLDDVKNYLADRRTQKDIIAFNKVVEGVRIIDPAVGSGHFLVSSLNELIVIKAQLGILADEHGNRLNDIDVSIANDELVVNYHRTQNFFEYTVNTTTSGAYVIAPEIQRIQQTLFNEKRKLIEGSLFGVDINPNSVKICQLRLWIELLKYAYYRADENFSQLETLPNIDINIKPGNSLLSKYSLNEDLTEVFKKQKFSANEYRQAVKNYKEAPNKEAKAEQQRFLKDIKAQFHETVSRRDPKRKRMADLRGQLVLAQSNMDLFGAKRSEKDMQIEVRRITLSIEKIEQEIKQVEENAVYRNAFEWRFEFPEVLTENGDFEGFEVIIGNPPYIQLQKMGTDADALQKGAYQTFERTGDIYCLFYEQAIRLLKPNYFFGFITSNKWMRANYGTSTRRFFLDNTNPLLLVDFSGYQVFDSATVETNILISQKATYNLTTQTCLFDKKIGSLEKLSGFVEQAEAFTKFSSTDAWVILSPIELGIKSKIEKYGTPLKDWDIEIYRGILTGYNEAFIIDGKKKDELIAQDPKSAEIIRPILRGRDIKRYKYDFADLWIIYIPWHFPLHNDPKIVGASELAEKEFKARYPAIYNHLFQYKKQLSDRNKAETGIRYEWYALQRWGANYMDDFSKQKIVWGEISDKSNFALDNDNNFYINNKCYLLTGSKLEYLVCFLNSKLCEYLFSKIGTKTGVGTAQWSKFTMEQLYVPIVSNESEELFETSLIKLKEGKVTIENIDQRIYEICNLTHEEINFIEAQ